MDRVVDKYIADELGENLTVVVDGINGRTQYRAGRRRGCPHRQRRRIGPADTASRPSDRAIAEDGVYRPSRHLEQAKFEGRVLAAATRAMSMPM